MGKSFQRAILFIMISALISISASLTHAALSVNTPAPFKKTTGLCLKYADNVQYLTFNGNLGWSSKCDENSKWTIKKEPNVIIRKIEYESYCLQFERNKLFLACDNDRLQLFASDSCNEASRWITLSNPNRVGRYVFIRGDPKDLFHTLLLGPTFLLVPPHSPANLFKHLDPGEGQWFIE